MANRRPLVPAGARPTGVFAFGAAILLLVPHIRVGFRCDKSLEGHLTNSGTSSRCLAHSRVAAGCRFTGISAR